MSQFGLTLTDLRPFSRGLELCMMVARTRTRKGQSCFELAKRSKASPLHHKINHHHHQHINLLLLIILFESDGIGGEISHFFRLGKGCSCWQWWDKGGLAVFLPGSPSTIGGGRALLDRLPSIQLSWSVGGRRGEGHLCCVPSPPDDSGQQEGQQFCPEGKEVDGGWIPEMERLIQIREIMQRTEVGRNSVGQRGRDRSGSGREQRIGGGEHSHHFSTKSTLMGHRSFFCSWVISGLHHHFPFLLTRPILQIHSSQEQRVFYQLSVITCVWLTSDFLWNKVSLILFQTPFRGPLF